MKLIHFLSLLLALLVVFAEGELAAQAEPDWTMKIPSKSQASLINRTADLLYLVTPDDRLVAVDYRDRKIAWETAIAGIKTAEVSKVDNELVLAFKSVGKTKLPPSDGRVVMVNALSGEVLYDEAALGMDAVKEYLPIRNGEGLLVRGTLDKDRVYGYLPFRGGGAAWVRPLPVELKRVSLRDKFSGNVIGNREDIIYNYAGRLFSVSLADGSVNWEKTPTEIAPRGVTNFGVGYANDQFFTPFIDDKRSYAIVARNYKTGAPSWAKPVNLSNQYTLGAYQDGRLFARFGNTFNLLDPTTGEWVWPQVPSFSFSVRDARLLGQEYLLSGPVITETPGGQKDTVLNLNILTESKEKAWDTPAVMPGHKLRFRQKLNEEHLLCFSDRTIAVIGLIDGKTIGEPVKTGMTAPFVDLAAMRLLGVRENKRLVALDLTTGEEKNLIFDLKLKGDERVTNIRRVGDNYAVICPRNVIMVNPEGVRLRQEYYPKPTDINRIANAIINTLAMVGGVVFNEEMREITRAFAEADNIDRELYNKTTYAQAIYGDVGAAASGGAYAQRYLNFKEKDPSHLIKGMNDHMIVGDKVGKGVYGLRFINLETGKDAHSIPLGKNMNFSYILDGRDNLILKVDEKAGELRGYLIIPE